MSQDRNARRENDRGPTQADGPDAVDEKRRRLLGQLGKSAYAAPVALTMMTMTAYAS